jgi:spore coat polysaccharide biosynthesis protein SpsF
MNNAIFITVRSDSTRLPNKALINILGRPTIEHIIIRAKITTAFKEIILCTTDRQIDDELTEIAEKNRIKYFRGAVKDKLKRWLDAAHKFDVDYFVTMDGDDLFCDPELMELGAKQMEEKGYDFLKAPADLTCGAFSYAIKTSALEKVVQIKDTEDTEMMWVYFEDTGLFHVGTLLVNDPIYYDDNIRLTLDYPEDLVFFDKVFNELGCKNNDIPLKRVMFFLKDNPQIYLINSYRQEDFLKNQSVKTKLLIKQIEE